LRQLLWERGARARIEIDGGISPANAAAVVAAGAEILVAGNAIFGKPDPGAALRELRSAAETGRMPHLVSA
jgi:ribulose-phosphate 3-epimerase